MPPRPFIRSETRPFLPSAATRTASSESISAALAIAAVNSASSFSRLALSVIFSPASDRSAKTRFSHATRRLRMQALGRHEGNGVRTNISTGDPPHPRAWPAQRYAGPGRVTGSGLASQPLLQGGLCLGNQSLEGLGLMDGEIGEHLAVHLDASLGEAVDKSRIGQAVLADTGVDTLDPERTEIAL